MLVDRAGKIVIGDQHGHGHRPRPARAAAARSTRPSATWTLGRDEGAKPLCGGAQPEGLAAGLDADDFFTPTIFAGVDNSAKIAQEEIFGPVLCVIPFESDDEAIAIANDSIYGLAGGVQCANLERAAVGGRRMRTGTVWINDYHMITPERPFGGYKQSGIGRELGTQGFEVYRQAKHVHVNPETSGHDNHIQYSVLSGSI